MGMYDSYIPDPPLDCPVCGERLGNWQGKEAQCLLLTWKQGHRFPIKHDLGDWVENDKAFLESQTLPPQFAFYTYGCKCNRWISAYGFCDKNTWMRSEIVTHLNWQPGPQNNVRDEHKARRDLKRWLESRAT
jgi:hypothetical protein